MRESPMDPALLRQLLDRFQRGEIDREAVLEELRHFPLENLAEARIDHHRLLRRGMPEIVYGQGKSADQIIKICRRMMHAGGPVLVSRLGPDTLEEVRRAIPEAQVHAASRMLVMGKKTRRRRTGILICSAGTSDLAVAEEVQVTLEALGHAPDSLHDVGVAGLHRLLEKRREIARASLIIAVAGMEGALPSVIAGLVAAPVIGVPTSTGYGTSFGGVSALLSMLNSCAGGLVVVNIDNGVGAALAAHTMVGARRRVG
ncbi:MAG: nickel pincer cofactor biosynthesis protein LarB [Acidobacteriota bacterium]